MKKFNLSIGQFSYMAKATNVEAENLETLAGQIAEFCKDSLELSDYLKAQGIGSENTRIKIGQPADLIIESVTDATSLTFTIKKFGWYVREHSVNEVKQTLLKTAEFTGKWSEKFTQS